MQQHILSNNVLTDNVLLIADKGKIFKGGYKAIVKEYYFQSAWTDREVVTKFRKLERAKKHIAKYYKEFETDNLTQD